MAEKEREREGEKGEGRDRGSSHRDGRCQGSEPAAGEGEESDGTALRALTHGAPSDTSRGVTLLSLYLF